MLYLNRYHSDLFGTFGVLVFNNKIVCHTYERPWLNNSPNVSCIPVGEYAFNVVNSFRYGRCFSINDVPNRSAILIHVGSSELDTKGCILPGLSVDIENNKVLRSRLAMDKLRGILPNIGVIKIRSF